MVEHRLLDLVIKTIIEITTLSDHSSVTMKMKILGTQKRPNPWILNEELIQDKEDEEKKRIRTIFQNNCH